MRGGEVSDMCVRRVYCESLYEYFAIVLYLNFDPFLFGGYPYIHMYLLEIYVQTVVVLSKSEYFLK